MSKFTVLTSTNRNLNKEFRIGPEGEIVKSPNAILTTGWAETRSADTPADLNDLIDSLAFNQALALGVLKVGTKSPIGTKASGAPVTRSKDHFEFADGPGWLLWDFDAGTMPPEVAARVDDLGGPLNALFDIWREARDAAYLIRASSSDGIRYPDGAAISSQGLHGFFRIENAQDSSEILSTLQQRAWPAGLAWYTSSKSGSLLERSIVDASVGSPERLVFEAPPTLLGGVTRDPRDPIINEGTVAALGAPVRMQTATDQAEAAKALAREAIKPVQAIKRAEFIEATAQRNAKRAGVAIDKARAAVVRMLDGGVLDDDHMLELRSGEFIRVGDMLDAVPKYHGQSICDPIEGSSYGEGRAKILLEQRNIERWDEPCIISLAHGVKTKWIFTRYQFLNDGTGMFAPISEPDESSTAPTRSFALTDPVQRETDRLEAAKTASKDLKAWIDNWCETAAKSVRACAAVKAGYTEIDEELDPNARARAMRKVRNTVKAEMGL